MCRARLGLKAPAWARLGGLGLEKYSSRALIGGSGSARARLGLSPGLPATRGESEKTRYK